MPRKDSILKTKTETFALRVIKLHQYLTREMHEVVMAKQLYRSGTSIGANVAESINAQTKADFITKLSIALKEANETQYWIKMCHQAGLIDQRGFNSINNDNEEIIKLLVSSIKTARRNLENDEKE
ncbi:MAG: four helix bundle protein [Prevotella sp.]|nr:four helix bundle protein [Prevotella sp.]